ncbi:MAG TPA: hypothetical protein VMD53_07915 [Rhizomicrobium sp.]|nr:hypothetical protein [Rhizomicrobium sp.]
MTLETIDVRRVGSALLVVLLHALVILALLRAAIHPAERPPPTREVILRFVQPSAPAIKPAAPPPSFRLIAPSTPVSPAPGEATTPPATNNTGSLRDLYLYLYECTPENFSHLTEAEKTRCAQVSLSPVPDDARSVRNQPSRAKDAPRWQRALARKKNPALLPCMSSGGFNPVGTALCLGNAAAQGGFGDLDEQPGYGDPDAAVHGPEPKTGVPPMSRAPQSPIESVGKP